MRAVARAATMIENGGEEGHAVIRGLFAQTGRALIVGVTGPPGAGKSTFIDQVVKYLRTQEKTVGVIAVDPTSPFSSGAILGDRIRMQAHHADRGVFIRSMASRGQLGGLAYSTMELALLLDASGLDIVLIETVGVGQDEIEIAKLADVTVVVLVPGYGDDVQAIKAGIMEVADVFVINKADLAGADRLEQDIRMMQNIAPPENRRVAATIHRIVALDGTGVEAAMDAIKKAGKLKKEHNQHEIWTWRLRQMARDRMNARLNEVMVTELAQQVANRQLDPITAADLLCAEAGKQ